MRVPAEMLHRTQMPREDAVRPQPLESAIVALLAGLLHPGRRHDRARSGGFHHLHRPPQADQLHEVELQLVEAETERCVHLLQRAQQRDQLRLRRRRTGRHRRDHRIRQEPGAHVPLGRRRPEAEQRLGEGASHPLQLGRGQGQRALQLELEPAHLQRRLAERAELLAQERLVQRRPARALQRHRALGRRGPAQVVARLHAKRNAHGAAHAQGDADLPVLRGDPLHLARHLGVLRLPDHVAGPDQAQIERALIGAAEDQLEQPGLQDVAGVQPSARLVVLGLALIEEDAVAGFQLRGVRLGPDQHVPSAGVDLLDAADQDAAMAGIEPVHQPLVIRSLQEAVREPAREAVAQLLLVARGERGRALLHRRVQRPPVLVHHVGDVFGPLHPALDLEAGDAGGEQLGQEVVCGQIARREEILELLVAAGRLGRAVDDQIVGHAAALRALAAVRAAVLERLAGQALSAPAHAERAVHEALELEIRLRGHRADLLDGELAREDHARDTQRTRHRGRLGRRDGHLGGRVQRQLRADLAGQPGDSQVLHEDRVGARAGDGSQRLLRDRQLAIEHQRVEGDESLDAFLVQEVEDPRQIRRLEVVRAGPCVEAAAQAEVDRVRPGGHRGLQALLVAGGREQLRLVQHLCHATAGGVCNGRSVTDPAKHQAAGRAWRPAAACRHASCEGWEFTYRHAIGRVVNLIVQSKTKQGTGGKMADVENENEETLTCGVCRKVGQFTAPVPSRTRSSLPRTTASAAPVTRSSRWSIARSKRTRPRAPPDPGRAPSSCSATDTAWT